MGTELEHSVTTTDSAPEVLDALIVGAGFAGVRQLYQFHSQGLNVRLVERGGGVGGTWYWNRYPGARTDSDAYSYSFYFTRELGEEWAWPDHFSSQEDIEKYMNWVIDRFGLRDSLQLNTTVTSAVFDEETSLWTVGYADGTGVKTRYLALATGMLSHPVFPNFPGLDSFTGAAVHTGLWPEEGIDLEGKRVAVFGAGSSAVQVVPNIAKVARSLTVFQRGGHWATPLNNSTLTAEEQEEYRQRFDDLRDQIRKDYGGQADHTPDLRSTLEVTEEERLAKYEYLYNEGRGLRIFSENFQDMMWHPEANKHFSDFLADKIRSRVTKPEVAEMLVPDHGFGRFRPPKDVDGYYECFNEEHVQLVSTKYTPVVEITPTSIKTTESEYEVDVIVFATGFDAWMGALRQMDIQGLGGKTLSEAWSNGPHTFLGMVTPNFPNLLFVGGAQGVGANTPGYVEVHAEWLGALVAYADENGIKRIEATEEASNAWSEQIHEIAKTGLVGDSKAWYFGGNIEGSDGKLRVYPAGFPAYQTAIAASAENGYEGLVLSK
ncbi:NAD(P)/FAD-dependent oxidoreductase [Arthrobacter sp. D1-29]